MRHSKDIVRCRLCKMIGCTLRPRTCIWFMTSSSSSYIPKENLTLKLGNKCLANKRTVGGNVFIAKKLVSCKLSSLWDKTSGGKRLQDRAIWAYRYVAFPVRALLRDLRGKCLHLFLNVYWLLSLAFVKKISIFQCQYYPNTRIKRNAKTSKNIAKQNSCFPASSGPEQLHACGWCWREKLLLSI